MSAVIYIVYVALAVIGVRIELDDTGPFLGAP